MSLRRLILGGCCPSLLLAFAPRVLGDGDVRAPPAARVRRGCCASRRSARRRSPSRTRTTSGPVDAQAASRGASRAFRARRPTEVLA